MISLVSLAATACFAQTQVQSLESPEQGQAPQTSAELRVTEITNTERAAEGLGPVRFDSKLSLVAAEFARDMMTRNFFDHVSPDGGTMGQRLQRGQIAFRAAGENIARGQRDAAAVMTAWMNSPGHRHNIMNGKYKRIGIGHVGNYWVMELTD